MAATKEKKDVSEEPATPYDEVYNGTAVDDLTPLENAEREILRHNFLATNGPEKVAAIEAQAEREVENQKKQEEKDAEDEEAAAKAAEEAAAASAKDAEKKASQTSTSSSAHEN